MSSLVKQREGYKVVVLEPAKTRLEKDQCPGCEKPKTEWARRKDWRCCSKECTTKYQSMYLILGWQDMRTKVFKRDNNTCQSCGFIAVDIKVTKCSPSGEKYTITFKNISSQLDADHILPIALGGDEWNINNIQTLCKPCHKVKTKEDIKSIAILRFKNKVSQKGQEFLS